MRSVVSVVDGVISWLLGLHNRTSAQLGLLNAHYLLAAVRLFVCLFVCLCVCLCPLFSSRFAFVSECCLRERDSEIDRDRRCMYVLSVCVSFEYLCI